MRALQCVVWMLSGRCAVDTRESSPQSFAPVTWPLLGSLILTSIVVALVCEPPLVGVYTWGRVLWLEIGRAHV